MRKLCFVLTALLLTAPAMADIVITCSKVGTDEVLVSYTSTDSNVPRAFGLDITVSDGNIVEITDANEYFWVYPGTIQISGGAVVDEGNPDAPNTDPCALGGPGTSGMTIEMGSLYDPCDAEHPTGPSTSETLLQFRVDASCTVTIDGNPARGNVVLENTEAAVTNLPTTCVITIVTDCFPSAHPDYAWWVSMGKPSCWCADVNPRQCHGDAANDKEGTAKTGYWYVGSNDLQVVGAGWKNVEPTKGSTTILGQTTLVGGVKSVELICADFAHDKEGTSKTGYWYIGSNDLALMGAYWKVLEPTKGTGTPADCPD